MNRTTNLFLILIVISFIFPVTAIRYAQAATENSQDSSSSTGNEEQQSNSTGSGQESGSSGSGQESGSSNTGSGQESGSSGSGQESGSSNTGSGQESGSSSSGNGPTSQASVPQSNSTGSVPQSNSTTSPIGSTANNNTLPVNTTHAYCDSCNNDIYYGKMDFANMVLAVHNRERVAVGVPPLAWNDTLAAGAKTWAEHLATTGKFEHSSYTDRQGAGENLAAGGHTTTVPIAQNMQGWVAEKNSYQGLPSATGTNVVGHYTQMVWRSTTTVGCGTATGGGRDVLVCRYSPAGNTGGPPY
jgi:uncharacterized protein YkwD